MRKCVNASVGKNVSYLRKEELADGVEHIDKRYYEITLHASLCASKLGSLRR